MTVAAYAGFTLGPDDPYVARLRDADARAHEAELWVAHDEQDDRMMGSVTSCPPGSPWREVAGPGEGEFRMLAVDPAAQGRGVGAALVQHVLDRWARAGTPTVVMTYWNPVERYGVERFAADLAAAGGAGLITPDLTPDSAREWIDAADAHGLDKVFLVAPSSTEDRVAMTTAACRGFVYATAVMGVTGARSASSTAAPGLVARIREAVPEAMVGVGLGVSNGAQAREIVGYADAAIVGSALVKTLLDAEDAGTPGDLTALRALVADLAEGVAGAGTTAR